MNPDICVYCHAGMHFLCDNSLYGEATCCCPVVSTTEQDQGVSLLTFIEPKPEPVVVKGNVGRPKKSVGEFEDQLSSGRKRAAKEFQIEPGQICEWAWRSFNGGGIVPVTGCTGRLAKHVHHGPDKSTLNNNRQTNISLICTFCHKLWHARNDKYYEGTRPETGMSWLPYKEGRAIHSLSESIPMEALLVLEFEYSINRTVTQEDKDRANDRDRLESESGSLISREEEVAHQDEPQRS